MKLKLPRPNFKTFVNSKAFFLTLSFFLLVITAALVSYHLIFIFRQLNIGLSNKEKEAKAPGYNLEGFQDLKLIRSD